MAAEFKPALTLSDEIIACVRRALEEDSGRGDPTTNNIVSPTARASALIVAKHGGVIAGLDVAYAVFLVLDEQAVFKTTVDEGSRVRKSQMLAEISGSARALLTAERTALNFLGRMSGIATLTREFVEAVEGTKAIILDTRKTAPGLRAIDKLAVSRGGGQNHRQGLYDMILIKDNHIEHAGSITEALRLVRASGVDLEIEVEARSLTDMEEALALGVGRILLDNITVAELHDAVALNAGRAKLEASGNITLENVRAIAETGVDFISVGALTHSARAFDVSLQWIA